MMARVSGASFLECPAHQFGSKMLHLWRLSPGLSPALPGSLPSPHSPIHAFGPIRHGRTMLGQTPQSVSLLSNTRRSFVEKVHTYLIEGTVFV